MSEKKRFRLGDAIVNVCSMPPPLAEMVVGFATKALAEMMTEKEVATAVKTMLVEKMPADMWQVIVGRNFSCFCTHEDGKYIQFYIAQTGFCVYAA